MDSTTGEVRTRLLELVHGIAEDMASLTTVTSHLDDVQGGTSTDDAAALAFVEVLMDMRDRIERGVVEMYPVRPLDPAAIRAVRTARILLTTARPLADRAVLDLLSGEGVVTPGVEALHETLRGFREVRVMAEALPEDEPVLPATRPN